MAESSIFESKAAAQGVNERRREFNIPESHVEAVKWVVYRLTKLTNDRLMIAAKVADVYGDAKAAGIPREEIAAALRLGKMTPERRSKYQESLKNAYELFGFTVEVAAEDPPNTPRKKRMQQALNSLKMLSEDRKEISQEISELCKCAKDRNMSVPVLRQIIKLSKMDEEARAEWLDSVDHIGFILGYWKE